MVDNFYRYGYRFQNQPFEFLPIEAFIGTFSLLMFVGLAYNVEKLRFSHVLKDTKAVLFYYYFKEICAEGQSSLSISLLSNVLPQVP